MFLILHKIITFETVAGHVITASVSMT